MTDQLLSIRVSEAYTLARMLLALVLGVILLECRVSALMRNLAGRFSSSKLARIAVYGLGFVVFWRIGIVLFNAAFYAVERATVPASTEWPPSFVASLQEAPSNMATDFAAILLFVICIRISARFWWAYYAVCLLLVTVADPAVSSITYPSVDHRQLTLLKDADPRVEQTIEEIIASRHFPVRPDQIQIVDRILNGDRYNSGVFGIGPNRRILLTRDLLSELTHDQLTFVIAHELSHFVIDDTVTAVLVVLTGTFAGFCFCAYAGRWLIRKCGGRWSLGGESDIAAYPVFYILFTLTLFFTDPMVHTYSRLKELRADRYALDLIQGVVPDWRDAAIGATIKLSSLRHDASSGEDNLSRPEEFWFSDHPTHTETIQLVQSYQPKASDH